MHIPTILLLTLFSSPLAFSSPSPAEPPTTNAQCGWPNGNCYDNNCHGDQSADGITCTSGPYSGCQCGYGCGRNTGRCDQNGCAGVNGRCTGAYRGCSCRN